MTMAASRLRDEMKQVRMPRVENTVDDARRSIEAATVCAESCAADEPEREIGHSALLDAGSEFLRPAEGVEMSLERLSLI